MEDDDDLNGIINPQSVVDTKATASAWRIGMFKLFFFFFF